MKCDKPSVAILPMVLLFLFSSFQFTIFDSLDHKMNAMDSTKDTELTVKIHKPGADFSDDQKLIWSPNNISDHREMQISLHAANYNELNPISMLNLKWIYLDNNLNITYSEVNTTDYTTNSTNNGIIVTLFFTYDEETWGGNYTLVVRLNLTDGTSLSGSSEEVTFKEQDFFIIMNRNLGDNFVCSCSQSKFSLTILNSGSSESFFTLSIGNSYVEYKPFSIELYDAVNGQDEVIVEMIQLSGGESYSVIVNFVPNSDLLPNRNYTIRPVQINITYEADNDEEFELYDDIPSFRLFSLPEYSYPKATVLLNDFNYERMFQTNSFNSDFNETIYTLGADYLLLEYDIINEGYSNSKVNLSSSIESSEIKILYDNLNLTLTEFNDMANIIEQNSEITFQVFLNVDPMVENLLFELDITFGGSYITNTAITLSYSPLNGNNIVSIQDNIVVFDSVDEVKVIPLKIDTLFLDNLTYFENKWSLLCTDFDGIMIGIIGLQYPCDGDETNLPVNLNSTYDIEISLENWETTQPVEIKITLYHNPIFPMSNISQSVSISVKLNMPEDNETGDNETEDNDTIIDEDERDLDIDNDGVLDSQDNCLNTKPDVIVDMFGCEVIVQDTDDDTENSDEIAVKSEESDFLSYAILSLLGIIAIVSLQFYRLKKPKHEEYLSITQQEHTTPLNSTPYQALEPVVLQQWTDANGYSWRQMSDQTIMWWNGTDWIPYGKN